MQVISSSAILQQQSRQWRAAGDTIAFVPTMGALHRGHAALLRQGRQRGTRLVVSIFVNPTQFGPNEDMGKYPRTLAADLDLCRECQVDAVFTPSAATMYPPGDQTVVEVTGLSQRLCGAHRPGHFRGMATVVFKLFQMVQPQVALFGEKDYQQLQIICRMVRDLLLPIDIIGVPTVRDADGLALSSRNTYLSDAERAQARAIPRALAATQARSVHTRETATLCALVHEQLTAAGIAAIDYVAIVDGETLEPIHTLTRPARLCLAVRIGATRLIDNVAVGNNIDII